MGELLKPRPFCGGTEAFVERLDYSSAFVLCDSSVGNGCVCLARGPVAVQEDDEENIPGEASAIAAWNRRAPTPPAPQPMTHAQLCGAFIAYATERGLDLGCRLDGFYTNAKTHSAWGSFKAGWDTLLAAQEGKS